MHFPANITRPSPSTVCPGPHTESLRTMTPRKYLPTQPPLFTPSGKSTTVYTRPKSVQFWEYQWTYWSTYFHLVLVTFFMFLAWRSWRRCDTGSSSPMRESMDWYYEFIVQVKYFSIAQNVISHLINCYVKWHHQVVFEFTIIARLQFRIEIHINHL